jgi:glycosyltransferase involved in cell wall biosynthesis
VLHIVIDSPFFGPHDTGVGIYAYNLIKNLCTSFPDTRFTAVLREKSRKAVDFEFPNLHTVFIDAEKFSLDEQLKLPSVIDKLKPDLVHFLNFSKPILYRKTNIITHYDLTHLRFPPPNASIKNYLGFIAGILLNYYSANKILAISEYSKQELEDFFKIPHGKTESVLLGFKPEDNGVYDQQLEKSVLNRFDLRKSGYLIYIGNSRKHKNLERLCYSFRKIKERRLLPKPFKLVLCGGSIKEKDLQGFIDESIILTGYINEEDKVTLLRNAHALVMPSLAEGFGLPVLEALAADTPVICSDASSLPEAGGECCVYFNPYSVDELTDKIVSTYENPDIFRSKRKLFRKHLEKLTWKRCAEATYNEYMSVLASPILKNGAL